MLTAIQASISPCRVTGHRTDACWGLRTRGPAGRPAATGDVTPGGPLLAGEEDTVTLTLDSAGHAGDLEAGAIEAAMQAAAKVRAAGSGSSDGRPNAAAGVTDVSTGRSMLVAAPMPPRANALGGTRPHCRRRLTDGAVTTRPQGRCWCGPATDLSGSCLCRMRRRVFLVLSRRRPPPPPDPAVLAQQAYGELTRSEAGREKVTAGGKLGSAVRRPALHLGRPLDIFLEWGMAAFGADGRAARGVGDGHRHPDGVGVRSG